MRGRGRRFKKKRSNIPLEPIGYQDESVESQELTLDYAKGNARIRGRRARARSRGALVMRGFRGKSHKTHAVSLQEDFEVDLFEEQSISMEEEASGNTKEKGSTNSKAVASDLATVNIIERSNFPANSAEVPKHETQVILVRNSNLFLKDDDDSLHNALEATPERVYLPDTSNLNKSLFKERLLQEITSVPAFTGITPSLQTEGKQMFFLIKHQDRAALEEAKQMIVKLVKNITAELKSVKDLTTSSHHRKEHTDVHPSAEAALTVGKGDWAPLEASHEDFLAFMTTGGPECNDKPVYGFITNIPRGQSAKAVRSLMEIRYRKSSHYAGPTFPFLSMVKYSDSSLAVKFCAVKFPSRMILQHVINTSSPIVTKKVHSFIKEVPPADANLKAMTSQIEAVLLSSASLQKSKHTSAGKKEKLVDINYLASAASAPPLLPANRPCGVFPGGIQPEKVVLVVDDTIPHLSLKELRNKGYDVLTGSNLDVYGFLQLITSGDHYRDDGVLYLVQPGLDFFLKNVEVIDYEMVESEVDSKLLRADEMFGSLPSFLMENFKKSVKFGKIHSNEDIFIFSEDDLIPLNKLNLPVPNIIEKDLDPTISASSSRTYFITSDSTRKQEKYPSNDGPAIAEVSSIKEKDSLSPSESEEQDSKSTAVSHKVHKASPLQTIVARILQQALALRNSVLINTLNSEVVFLGYPVECLQADNAPKDFPEMPQMSLKHLAASLIASLHLFNIFAAKTWKLGGFPSLNFNNDLAICMNDSVPETKKHCIKTGHETITVADHDSEDVKELTFKNKNDSTTTSVMKSKDGVSEGLRGVTLNCSSETIMFNDSDHDNDITPCAKSTSTKQSPKDSDLADSLLPDGSNKALLTEVEVIDLDVEDQEVFLYELDSNGDAVNCQNLDAIEVVSTETVPPAKSKDILDLSLLKQLYVVERNVTADVVRALDLVTEHYKLKGNFPPWTSIEGESDAFNPHGKSSILREYVQCEFFTEEQNSHGKTVYQCAYPCKSSTCYTAEEAEGHVYTRLHTSKMNALATKASFGEGDQARHLINHVKEHGTPVVKDQIKKLIKFGILQQLKLEGLKYYSCLLCPATSRTFDGVSLRSHLQDYAHLNNLMRSLGIEGFFTVHAIENWRTVKRALRYSTMDVVIVADDMHLPALRVFTNMHSRVHVVTVPGLVRRAEGREEALHRCRQALEWRDVALTEPHNALWLIVTGMDLLVQPAHLIAAVEALAAQSSEGGASSPPTAEKNSKEELVLEQVLFDEDIACSKSSGGVPSSTETVTKPAGDGSILGVETVLLKENSATGKDQKAINWTTVIDNFDETIKKSVTSLVKLHSFLRVQLPPNTKVLVVPSLPLAILPDTAPKLTLARVMQHKHAVTTPPHMAKAVSRAYASLSEQVYSIHSQNSIQENLFSMNKTFFGCNIEVGVNRQFLVTTQWHVAVEEIVLNALHGMPAVIPNLTADDNVNIMKLGFRTNGWKGVIVGKCPYLNISQMRKDSGVSVIPRALQDFNNEDMDAVIIAAKRYQGSAQCVWYLTCPFPQILFKSKDCEMCVDLGCSKRLKLWSPLYDVPQDQIDDSALRRMSRNALIRVNNFITLLQSKLPPNNFVTLFPIFPSSVISVDSVEKNTHGLMHSLEDDFPCTFFSLQPVSEVLIPFLNRFRQGWLALFQKISLGHILNGNHRSFMQVKACQINNARRFLAGTVPRSMRDWHAAVQSLLFHHSVVVKLSTKQMKLLDEAALEKNEKKDLSSISASVIPDSNCSGIQQIDCRELLNQRWKKASKKSVLSLPLDGSTACSSRMVPHTPRCSAQQLQSRSPRFRSRSPDLRLQSPGLRERSFDLETINRGCRTRSPGHWTRSTQLGGPPMQGTCVSPIFVAGSPSFHSSFRRNRSPQMEHQSSFPSSRSLSFKKRLTDFPDQYSDCRNRSYSTSNRTHLSQEKRGLTPEGVRYIPRRPDHGCITGSSRERASGVERNRLSLGVQHLDNDHFPPSPKRRRITSDPRTISPDRRFRISSDPCSRLSPDHRCRLIPRLSPERRPRLSPDRRPRLSPERRPRWSLERHPRLSPERRPRLSPERRPRLSPDRRL